MSNESRATPAPPRLLRCFRRARQAEAARRRHRPAAALGHRPHRRARRHRQARHRRAAARAGRSTWAARRSKRPAPTTSSSSSRRTGVEAGCWGGLLTLGAKVRGVAGVVADGPVRDIDEAIGYDFPVFSRGAHVVHRARPRGGERHQRAGRDRRRRRCRPATTCSPTAAR